MAKLEKEVWTDFEELLGKIQYGILNESVSATLEDSSDFFAGNARCSVRVFERYSAIGSNRVSQAVLFKINTMGEKSFLDCLQKILDCS